MTRLGHVLWFIAFALMLLTFFAYHDPSGVWMLYAIAAVPATLVAFIVAGLPTAS